MAADTIWRFTMKARDSATNQFRYVFHFSQNEDNGAALTDDFSEMWSDYAAAIKTMLASTITLWGWEAHWLDETGHWQPFAKGAEDIVGTGAATTMPYQIASVFLGYTARGKTIGKKFIGPIATTSVVGGNLTEAFQTLAAVFCTLYGQSFQGSGGVYFPGTWSKLKGFHKIISTVCDILVGTQRRRKPGVGQ